MGEEKNDIRLLLHKAKYSVRKVIKQETLTSCEYLHLEN
jgi:hypothetical protein